MIKYLGKDFESQFISNDISQSMKLNSKNLNNHVSYIKIIIYFLIIEMLFIVY